MAIGDTTFTPRPAASVSLPSGAGAPEQGVGDAKAGSGFGTGQASMSLRERWGGTTGARAADAMLEAEPSEGEFDLAGLSLPEASEPTTQQA